MMSPRQPVCVEEYTGFSQSLHGADRFPSIPIPLQHGTEGLSPPSAPSLCPQQGKGKGPRPEQTLHLIHVQPNLPQTPKQILK